MSTSNFKFLFSPLKIGSITIKNRIFTPAFGTNMTGLHHRDPVREEPPNDFLFEKWLDYHEERAKGGFGLIETSEFGSHITGCLYNMSVLPDNRYLPIFTELASRVHKYGTKLIPLIHNLGPGARSMWTFRETWGPSAVRNPFNRELNHEMEPEEIRDIIDIYPEIASMFQKAGCDGIQLQAAHNFLIGSFLSPATNKRKDKYGGELDNRMRFLIEVIQGIRKKCGYDFVLGTTLSGDELIPGGYNLDEGKKIAKRLEDVGIDYIEVRLGGARLIPNWIGDMSVPLGVSVPLAAAIREVVDVPVLTVNRIKDPLQAEKILSDGHADMIGLARGSLCDPEWPNKASQNMVDEIRACVGCHQGCTVKLQMGRAVECIQNPAAGREKIWGIGTLKRAKNKKKVIVVGGGPAGLKAAEIAAERGHRVILYEKDSILGGQVTLAKLLPTREEIGDITRHLEDRVKKLGVELKLGAVATAEIVKNEEPDAVVIATGSIPVIPEIPGNKQDNVITVHDLLRGEKKVGSNVVVLDGGEACWKFAGTVEYLSRKNLKRIVAVSPYYFIGFDIPPLSLPLLMRRLVSCEAVDLQPMATVTKIEGQKVHIMNVMSGQEKTLEDIDTVVVASDQKVCFDLYRGLKDKIKEIYSVGDCVAPRKIDAAIMDGYRVGRQI